VDDRELLKEISVDFQKTRAGEIPFYRLGTPDQVKIYFFSKPENARSFFSESQKFPSITILMDEEDLPRSVFSEDQSVYLLSVSKYFDSREGQSPEWKGRLTMTLFRIFILEHYDALKKGFEFVSDSLDAISIVEEFKNTALFQYLKFEETCLRGRRCDPLKSSGTLVYNTDSDPILESLFDYLQSTSKKVFRINGSTGWVSGKGQSRDVKLPSAESFANDLLKNEIGEVYFRNFYDMAPTSLSGINKLWVMERLGVKAYSVAIDSLLDGLNPILLHFLPKNVEAIALHSTESLDTFSRFLAGPRVHAAPQAIPAFRMEPVRVSASKSIVGLIVASGSRLSFLREQLRMSFLFLPVVKFIMERNLPIYLTYFLFIDAAEKASKVLKLKDQFIFFDQMAAYSVILRTFVRYFIIDRGIQAAKERGLSFELYGDEDWKGLFPEEFQGKYISQEDLLSRMSDRILIDPTPSTTFLSQHPMIPRYLFYGGSVIAPGFLDEVSPSSLSRFYFCRLGDFSSSLQNLLNVPRLLAEERAEILATFGVQKIVDRKQALTFQSGAAALARFSPEDRALASQFGSYCLAIFHLMILKTPKKMVLDLIQKESSPEFFSEISAFVENEKTYLKSLSEKYRFLKF
jgi:hypothetical protein